MNKSITYLTLSSVLILSAFITPPVMGQQDDNSALKLEEVVVTARRRDENLQDVPMSVSALTGEELELRGATDISEIAQVVPSVTIEASRATNSTLTAFIRGVGQQDPLAGFEQGVALYLDDVYIARPQGALLDIYDVERVEVLRGPQGTLYGRNAVGGAIKYVTSRLGDEDEYSIKASLGSHGQTDFVGTAAFPVSDTLKVGATLASLKRDGYGDNLTTGEGNYNKDVFAYRISTEYAPTDNLFFRLSYDKSDDDSAPVAGHRPYAGAISGDPVLTDLRDTTAGASLNQSTAGIGGNNTVEAEGIHFSGEWTVNDKVTLKSISAWRDDYTESVIDFDSLEVDDFDAQVIYENEQFSQEFQLLFNSDRMNAVAGIYYLNASAANDFDVVLGQLGRIAFGSELTAYTGGIVDTEALSFFADVTYDLTDKLSVSAGGRYTEDERAASIYRGTFLGSGSTFFGNDSAIQIATTSDYGASRTYTDFSPRLNFSYEMNDDMNLYAGYSQGFKAGSFDPRGANFATPEVEKGFAPESLDSFEAGLKSTWLGGRARSNIAVFYSDYQDMQIPGSVGIDTNDDGINDDFAGTVTNAGQAEIQGIEMEGSFLITERLTAQLAVSLLDAEIKEWIVNDINIAADRVVQNTPETMAYLGLSHTTDFSGGSLNLNANWSYKDDTVQFELPVAAIDQEAHSLINASIVWSSDNNWSLGLHGKNLTDEDIKTAGYCFGSGGCPSTLGLEDNTTVFYAPPRTVTATYSYRF